MRKDKSADLELMSVADYLASEETATVRHEFIDGQRYPMPGTTDLHNLICQAITFALWQLLANTDCKVFMENVKVEITDQKRYTYPDVFVTCSPDDNDPYVKRMPVLIVEVASPSTRVYDKTDKFLEYRKISSLRHYLVVDTDRALVESYQLGEKEWSVETYTDIQQQIPLVALDCKLTMEAIYSGVSLSAK